MSSGYAWVKSAAQRLSDQRQVAGWRPATVEAASFSSRGMRILRTLQQLEYALSDLDAKFTPVVINKCGEATAYLIVWLQELDVSELGEISKMTCEQVGTAELVNTVEVRDKMLGAWEYWSEDRLRDAVHCVGRALVVMLALCQHLDVDVEMEVKQLDFGKRKPGGRHPDTW